MYAMTIADAITNFASHLGVVILFSNNSLIELEAAMPKIIRAKIFIILQLLHP
jgi:hypothetical protein